MKSLQSSIQWVVLIAACVEATASWPSIPTDLTTPVQQRIAIKGPNGKCSLETDTPIIHIYPYSDTDQFLWSRYRDRLEHILKIECFLCSLRY